MPHTVVPSDVRFAIYDTVFAYAWALDRADAAGVAATFTPGGAVTGVAGTTWRGREGVQAFALQAFQQPGFAGRQHHVQPLFIVPDGDAWKMTSYWMAVTWDAGRAPAILSMGWYEDRYALQEGAWLCESKVIRRWDSGSAPMAGASAPIPGPDL